MQILLVLLFGTAVVCWSLSLLAFIATAALAFDGWETNIGAGLTLLAALSLTFLAQLLTLGAVLAQVVGQIRKQVTAPYTPLRKLLWGATAIMAAGAAMLLATGFEFRSYGVAYLLGNMMITGITAVAVSVADWQYSRRTSTG